ncbi:MAG: hypothetical protein O3A00_23150 [Planctomycetota bacterium]|nr:hypothetical protein [Planctomycetota bacterium]
MSEEFDPYYTWLAIPPKDQPPDHYRILGIETFESNTQVIDAAANRQLAYLQEMASGPHRKHAQKILNEVASARRCLLDAERKSKYDAKLQTLKAEAAKPAAPRAAAPAPSRATQPQSEAAKPLEPDAKSIETKYLGRRRTSSGAIWMVGAVTSAVALWVILTYVGGEKEYWKDIPQGFPPTCEASGQVWRYTTKKPIESWIHGAYDDSGWGESSGAFGKTGETLVNTEWTSDAIWLRRKFQLEAVEYEKLTLRYFINGGCQIYLNGKNIAKLAGTDEYTETDMTKFKAYFTKGVNTLAVYVKKNPGTPFIDVGIVE